MRSKYKKGIEIIKKIKRIQNKNFKVFKIKSYKLILRKIVYMNIKR